MKLFFLFVLILLTKSKFYILPCSNNIEIIKEYENCFIQDLEYHFVKENNTNLEFYNCGQEKCSSNCKFYKKIEIGECINGFEYHLSLNETLFNTKLRIEIFNTSDCKTTNGIQEYYYSKCFNSIQYDCKRSFLYPLGILNILFYSDNHCNNKTTESKILRGECFKRNQFEYIKLQQCQNLNSLSPFWNISITFISLIIGFLFFIICSIPFTLISPKE